MIDKSDFLKSLEKERDDYTHENCIQDPETGVWEGGGKGVQEYLEILEDFIEKVRTFPETDPWKLAPDRPGFWWWRCEHSQNIEMVEACEFAPGYCCLYVIGRVGRVRNNPALPYASGPWGGDDIRSALERRPGRWLYIPEPRL